MTKRRSIILLAVCAGVLALGVGLATLLGEDTQYAPGPLPQSRALLAAHTAQPGAILWCIDNDHCDATPQPIPTYHPKYTAGAGYPIGIECNGYMPNVWGSAPTGCSGDTCSTTNIDWGYIDDCLADAANNTVTLRAGEVISQPVALMIPPYFADGEADGDSSCGTTGDPCGAEYVPGWLESDFLFQFAYGGNQYWGYRYDSAAVLQYFKAMLNEAAELYADNDQVSLIRLCPGFQCESQPVKHQALGDSGNDALREAHESAGVTCAEYRAFMRALTEEAIELFPNKPVIFPSGPPACGNASYDEDYQWRYGFLGTTTDSNPGWWVRTVPTPVGYGAYAAAPDFANGTRYGANSSGQDWGFYASAKRADSLGFPVVFEYKNNSFDSSISAEDKWQYNYWTALSAAGNGGDWTFPYQSWAGYYPIQYWNVIWDKLGDHDDYAYSVQRDAESPAYSWSSGTYGTSGTRGNFENNITLLNAANNAQACSVALKTAATRAVATAAAGGNTIDYDPCPVALPTAKPTFQPTPVADATADYNMLQRVLNRQARQIAAGGNLVFAADTAWSYYGDTRAVTLTLTYLDDGTDAMTLTLPLAAGVTAAHVITKANSDLWQQAVITDTAYIVNDISDPAGAAFITVANGAGDEYIHQLEVRVGAEDGGPTATPTSTATPGPTATPGGQIAAFSFADANANGTYDSGSEFKINGNIYYLSQDPNFFDYLCSPFAADEFGGCDYNVAAGVVYDIEVMRTVAPNYVKSNATSVYQVTAAPTAQGTPQPLAFAYVTMTPAATRTVTPTPTRTATPTVAPSWTPTVTPTRTRTPRPTMTAVTPTATRTATMTPDWPALNCPALTPVVNGSLSEWTAVTPVALAYTSATYIQPPTPIAPTPVNTGTPTVTPAPTPNNADLSATLYCGHAGNVLYFAGTILDNTVTAGTTYNTDGSISAGDAVRITLDGASDGLADVGGDDHDLYLAPDGRVLDFDTAPISVTVATIANAGGWTFELALDASTLELASLTSGTLFGLAWHLHDADDANGVQHIFDDRKRWAVIP